MKLYFNIFFLISFFVTSCKNKPVEQTIEVPAEAPKEVPAIPQSGNTPPPTDCYSYMSNNDTIILQINHIDNQAKGLLIYNYDQKDENIGTIQGSMVNDLLVAEYVFRSEGITSSRQVVFKKQGDAMVEGFGDVQEVNGKMKFKDIQSLKYNDGMVLKKVPCTQ